MDSCKSFPYIENMISIARKLQGTDKTAAFARKIGMTQQKVDKYLKGETTPPIEFLVKVATTFNVTTDTLLGLNRAGGDTINYEINVAGRTVKHESGPIKNGLSSRVEDLKRNAAQATDSINKLLESIDKIDGKL